MATHNSYTRTVRINEEDLYLMLAEIKRLREHETELQRENTDLVCRMRELEAPDALICATCRGGR